MSKLIVDTAAIKHNINNIRSMVDTQTMVMPIIKANAYGAGFEAVAKGLVSCEFVGVADISEAHEYNQFNIAKSTILILYQPSMSDIDKLINVNYHVAVTEIDFLVQLNHALKNHNSKPIKVHISIDTGLGTIGVVTSEIEQWIERVKLLTYIEVVGAFSQFGNPESQELVDIEFSNNQIKLFSNAVKTVERVLGCTLKYKHMCCSGAIVGQRTAHFDMVRPGYIVYGYYPQPFYKEHFDLKPALKMSADILSIRKMKKGTQVGYTGSGGLIKDSLVASIAIGYSDGISRKLAKNGYMVVNGQKSKIVGGICMDLCNIDITDIEGKVSIGDSVYVWDNSEITLEEVATNCDIGLDELLSHINRAVERVSI